MLKTVFLGLAVLVIIVKGATPSFSFLSTTT